MFLLARVEAKTSDLCIGKCVIKCNLFSRGPVCVAECLKKCYTNIKQIEEMDFKCTNGCAKSRCKDFTSGIIIKI